VATVASATRWWWQGSQNIYTDLSKSFYVPDPDLGWRLLSDGPVWLGLDAVLVMAGVTIALLVAAWWVGRWERGSSRKRWLRAAMWMVSVVTLSVPAVAFASGGRPKGARDQPPQARVERLEGLSGSLALSAGSYGAIAHHAHVTATLRAGGESFEARFGGVQGQLRGNPGNLKEPLWVSVSVDAKTVDTGIALRNQHARDDLQVEKHPRISFDLNRIVAAESKAPGRLEFEARGTVFLVGRTHPVVVKGSAYVPDAAARTRLGVSSPETLVVEAAMELDIAQTAIGNDGTFDHNKFPIRVRVLFVRTPE
jgi:polyisoprenoid-binding protein YceI